MAGKLKYSDRLVCYLYIGPLIVIILDFILVTSDEMYLGLDKIFKLCSLISIPNVILLEMEYGL